MERFAPYIAAALLDAIDLGTFGPLGVWVGFVIGSVAGWFLAESLGFQPQNRWKSAALAGLYCMLPGTSVLPLATVITTVRQLTGKREPEREESIDVEYRAIEKDDRER